MKSHNGNSRWFYTVMHIKRPTDSWVRSHVLDTSGILYPLLWGPELPRRTTPCMPLRACRIPPMQTTCSPEAVRGRCDSAACPVFATGVQIYPLRPHHFGPVLLAPRCQPGQPPAFLVSHASSASASFCCPPPLWGRQGREA